MKRVCLIALLLALASNASAVEVFVKSNTKLYDGSGKVIREVTAGFPFRADKANGDWVYGFLRTRSGGIRGWIPIAALDLDDEARRKLGAVIATRPDGTKVEPVLLRYKLAPGELHVYEINMTLSVKLTSTELGKITDTTTAVKLRLGYDTTGKSRATDGTILADVHFHAFDMQVDVTRNGIRTQMTADEKRAALYLNGSLVASGEWGAPGLSALPNLGELLTTTVEARITERGEVLEMQNPAVLTDEVSAFDMREIVGSSLVFPEKPVGPGDSWEEEVNETVQIGHPGDPATSVVLSGKAKYTVLERTTYANRPCTKIAITASTKSGPASGQLHVSRTVEGVSYIEEATGIELRSELTLGQTVGGSLQGASVTGTMSASGTLIYKGNKLE
jgi:hypothetical protein